jgi:hypothetical protein
VNNCVSRELTCFSRERAFLSPEGNGWCLERCDELMVRLSIDEIYTVLPVSEVSAVIELFGLRRSMPEKVGY